MSYINLSGSMQNLLVYQFETSVKIILFVLIIGLALFYQFYYKKNVEKPTPFFTVGILRVILTALSQVSILLFPLGLITLSPQFSATTFYTYVLYPYMLFLLVFTFIVVIDFIYFAPQILLKFSGMNVNNPKVNKVYNMLQRYVKRVR